MSPGNRIRPEANRTDSQTHLVDGGGPIVSQLPDIATVLAADDWDDLAQHVDGTFVLVVKVTGGRYRRRCFLSVKAAENAARRAQEHGHSAVVLLAELKPVFRVMST